MSKSQNRHDTVKWKRANCNICSYHKNLGNSKGKNKAKYWDNDYYTKRHLE